MLTVSGSRRSEDEAQGAEFYVRERFYGEFRRVITLPDGTEASQLHAEFDDGLVQITVSQGVSPTESTRIALADRSTGTTSRRVVGEEA